jgi:hypothetical protein
MIVLLGDNGTYYPGVKAPFNFERAKGTVYQTGVWVPLIVAGPLVRKPDRDVEHMVNVADLYELFGEIAGLDVRKLVPKARPIDSAPMLPYLVNPRQESLRRTNFTQAFDNIKATGTIISPCVLQQLNICTQIFPQQQLCAAENGTWYGPNGAAGPQGLTSCCAVNKLLLENNQPIAKILPSSQLAIRNDSYKLVMTQTPEYNAQADQCDVVVATEFYRINEAAPIPRLDNANLNLLASGKPPLTARERAVFANLSQELKRLLSTHADCPGDGNLDGVVNEQDRVEWSRWVAATQSQSSWYDFNLDGLTNGLDLQTINQNFGQKCPGGR